MTSAGARFARVAAVAIVCTSTHVVQAVAQPLGTFRWQLLPHCNVLSLTVTQNGAVYELTGTDDQCGTAQKASAAGVAFMNPSGLIGFGLSIVTTPGAFPVHVEAAISLGSLSGLWRDSAGHSGTFAYTPGPIVPGFPRPTVSGGIPPGAVRSEHLAPGAVGAVAINSAEVQRRVGGCPQGQAMSAVNPDGTPQCIPSVGSPGSITASHLAPGAVGTAAINPAEVQRRVQGACQPGEAVRVVNVDGTVSCQPTTGVGGPTPSFTRGGNAFGGPAQIGTLDDHALVAIARGAPGWRLQPSVTTVDFGAVPNLVGGWFENGVGAEAIGATIGGGGARDLQGNDFSNRVWTRFGTVAGGLGNEAGQSGAGGSTNATVAGGAFNRARGQATAIGGGHSNTAVGDRSTIAGGESNWAQGSHATIAGGQNNSAGGPLSTIGGGLNNGTTGRASVVLGGEYNSVSGAGSVAAGSRATVGQPNTFLWNGWSNDGAAFAFRPNAFEIRGENGLTVEFGTRQANGGGSVWLHLGPMVTGQVLATSTGAFLSGGGAWTNASDRNRKTDFERIDPNAVLARVLALPLTTWRYKADPVSVRHLGPVAQDFEAAFGLGAGDTSIATVDADGVALAALQGLNAKLEREVDALRQEVATLRAQLATLLHEVQSRRGQDR